MSKVDDIQGGKMNQMTMFKKIIAELLIRAAVPGLVFLVLICAVLAAIFWGIMIVVSPRRLSRDGNPFLFASDLATLFNVESTEKGLTIVVEN